MVIRLNDVILETRNLIKRFGGITAVDNVNLKVERGSLHAIIGPNGAGKTTLFNCITGVLKPDSGEIIFEGRDVTGLPPHKISRIGIGRSFQLYSLFPNLTVLENVRLAVQARYEKVSRSMFKPITAYKDIIWESMSILSRVGLWGKSSILAKDLTPSDKRKLEIAIALATRPKLLALDEPTSGVSVEDIPIIVNVIERIKKEYNLTLLIIEHKIDVVLKIADIITVMDRGKIIAEGSPEKIINNRHVQEIYLGVV